MPASTIRPACRLALLAGVAILAPVQSAGALEAGDFAAKLQQALGAGDGSLEFGSATVTGDTVVLSDVEIRTLGAAPLDLEAITFTGVAETSDGGYAIDEVSIPDLEVAEDGVVVTVSDMSLSQLELPGDTGGDTADSMPFYQQARSGPVTVSVDQNEVFSLDEIVIDVSRRPEGQGFDTMMRAGGLLVDLSSVEDAKAREAIDGLGYEQLNGQMRMAAGWDLDTGNLDVSEFALNFDDVGTLSFAFDISGYTPDFIEAMQETQDQAEAGTSDEMTGMAVLGLMQQLTFNSASIRFEDETVTEKVLDYVGTQQGADGEQFAEALKGMLPLFVAQLQNPDLQAEIQAALEEFLDDPQNLTIEAAPDEPVPFTTIMGAGLGAPQTLPNVLGVTVRAND